MNLYRNKNNYKLYWAENVILEWHYFNMNAFAGVYAHPYKHNSESIIYYYNHHYGQEGALKAFHENFEVVAELFHL